jgi:hypothetical protein
MAREFSNRRADRRRGRGGRRLVEAIRIADAPAFALGVQWHAEYDPQHNPINRALFKAFGARTAGSQTAPARGLLPKPWEYKAAVDQAA